MRPGAAATAVEAMGLRTTVYHVVRRAAVLHLARLATRFPMVAEVLAEAGDLSRLEVDQVGASVHGAGEAVIRACTFADEVKAMLVEKNRRYGDSVGTPLRLFSRADEAEQLRVRIDDKLSRIARGSGIEDEDVVKDLVGYLLLLGGTR
jgi:acetyl-CoA acetyltransferase